MRPVPSCVVDEDEHFNVRMRKEALRVASVRRRQAEPSNNWEGRARLAADGNLTTVISDADAR